MQALDYFQTMCRYNRWMNEKIYAVCAEIPDAIRKEDQGAWFRSIHGTLNHLLLGDRIWLGRFMAQPFAFTSLAQGRYADFDELRRERAKTDADLQSWIDTLDEEQLIALFTYTNSQGQENTFLLWTLLLHLFNHQTHHRGQLTTLLEQSGYDSGVTDLLMMPGVKL